MSQFSEEDRPVVEFLRQYRPPVPPAQPELEDRVMEAIPRFHRRPKRPLWLVSGTLAAGFLAAIATHSILSPRGGLSEAEVAQLEAYVERHWGEFFGGGEAEVMETADIWLLPDTPSLLSQEN
ncbi:MAG: hypothetical protein LRZ84_19300 [Desertifilum sp.]|nr:hypothetical protein [Desertifilum sp.]